MADYKEKTATYGKSPKRRVVTVEGSGPGCPLTRDLRRIRHDPSVVYYSNHLWAREEDGEIIIGLNDLSQKLLQPIRAWIGPSPGQSTERSEHLFWVQTLGGLISFDSPFNGTILRFNEELYSQPQLPGRSPYDRGWVLSMVKEEGLAKSEVESIPSWETEGWLRGEALRWERLIMKTLGITEGSVGATADGGNVVTDPWIAVGPRGMQELFTVFFNPL